MTHFPSCLVKSQLEQYWHVSCGTLLRNDCKKFCGWWKCRLGAIMCKLSLFERTLLMPLQEMNGCQAWRSAQTIVWIQYCWSLLICLRNVLYFNNAMRQWNAGWKQLTTLGHVKYQHIMPVAQIKCWHCMFLQSKDTICHWYVINFYNRCHIHVYMVAAVWNLTAAVLCTLVYQRFSNSTELVLLKHIFQVYIKCQVCQDNFGTFSGRVCGKKTGKCLNLIGS